MKIRHKILASIKGIKDSSRRFPISLIISIVLVILRIYAYEIGLNNNQDFLDKLTRISMVVGLGIPLSLSIGLGGERFFNKDRMKTTLAYIIGILSLGFYYSFLLKEINNVSMIRYVGVNISLIIIFFYIARIKIEGDYEKYVVNIFSSIAETQIYSLVLLLGSFMILFTINQLFDVNIDGKYYYYIFLIIYLIFALAFLISKLPAAFEDFSQDRYTKFLTILLSYIVIPLISIYTLILYIYFGKILILWEWPQGLVSHLVLWYSALSVGVIFLITPIIEENKIGRYFKLFFPKLILPILLMMFISIGIRINEYGITENRYYILALGIWVTAMMVYLAFRGVKKNIIIPITLSLVVLNSIFGPFSSIAISRYSQNKRLKGILESHGMLEGNKIIRKTDLDKKSEQEISNILNYFETKHSLKNIKVLDDSFTTREMEDVFGFKYDPNLGYNYGGNYDEYLYYGRENQMEGIEIDGYDYFLQVPSYVGNQKIRIGDMEVFEEVNGILKISGPDDIEISEDLNKIALGIYERAKASTNGKGSTTTKDMTYERQYDNIRIKLIFNEISIRIDRKSLESTVEYANYLLFIDRR